MPTQTKGFYSFLPYLRQGLAGRLTNPDIYNGGTSPNGERASFQLTLSVQKTKVDGSMVNAPVNNTVNLKGPGDVTGINGNAIIKIHPSDWVTNFEPNYLPYIEFYDEDFPWRYTPANFNNENSAAFKYRLRPWVTLVVLKEDEFENILPFNGILPVIGIKKVAGQIFPSQKELWAWAHVHVNDNLSADDSAIGTNPTKIQDAVDRLKSILDKNPDKAVSRIISPRRLEANTGYHAFLIPTFEGGRLAGLGQDTEYKMLDPAWGETTPAGTQYPVYKQWFFKTGGAGDFESLVRLLQPRILDDSVGKRQMDLQQSNNKDLEAIAPPVPIIGLQGVIQPTDAVDDPFALNSAYAEKIREIVNAPAEIIAQVGGDPIIAPPIYGCWHAAQNEVPSPGSGSGNWIQQVNLDPRYRVFAGAGTETLRRNQEKYMGIAWQQVGDVIKANQKLRRMQLTKQANTALYEKHLTPLGNELLLNISAPVHNRIKGTIGKTVYKNVSESAIPVTMLSAAFRRLTRPNGPLISTFAFTAGAVVTTAQLISDVNNGVVQPTSPIQVPAGQFSYNVWNNAQLTPQFTSSLPTNSGFVFSNPGIINNTPAPGPNPPVTQVFVNAVVGLHALITSLPGYNFNVNPALPIASARTTILQRTDPSINTLALATQSIGLKNVHNDPVGLSVLNTVLAAPKIRTPMFGELAKLSPDWIMPGLNDIGNNTISILQTNRKYLEAYMLGLNHAMAEELLWRGYPTDQRGTPFSFFWDYNNSMASVALIANSDDVVGLDDYRDIKDIHLWRVPPANPTSVLSILGANNGRIGTDVPEMLVLLVRGELLRKYPGSIVYMQKAAWNYIGPNPDTTKPRKVETGSSPVYPVFTSKIEPDIYMLGFAGLTAEEARGGGLADTSKPGYFVVFQERAGEIRFGADEYDPTETYFPTIPTWNDVNWWNIVKNQTPVPADISGFIDTSKTIQVTANTDTVTWNANAASIAYALQQAPVKLNVHAESLIPA